MNRAQHFSKSMANHLSHGEEGRRGINFILVESIAELDFSQVHGFNFIAHLMHCQQMFYVSINVQCRCVVEYICSADNHNKSPMRLSYSAEVSAMLNLHVCLFPVPD